MKIKEITQPEVIIEGSVDINALLSVRNILLNQKITNSFEVLVIARSLQLLKAGLFFTDDNLLFTGNVSVPKVQIDYLKNLENEKMLVLAQKIYDILTLKNQSVIHYKNPTCDYNTWIDYMTRTGANYETY